MKKKRLDMQKLSLKKSTIAQFEANNVNGGYWGFTNFGCNISFGPGEPCGPTDLCPPQTQGCPPPQTQGCPPPQTQGCPPLSLDCPSHSICPAGIACF